jgi:uncharacterized protein
MQLSREIDPFAHSIRGYGPGEVTVILPYAPDNTDQERSPANRLETLRRSAIITPRMLIRDWPPQRLEDIEQHHFEAIIALRPEIVLFGSGATLRWLDHGLTSALMAHRIGVEVMDTAAACRTYNILMADERNVAAALLMI